MNISGAKNIKQNLTTAPKTMGQPSQVLNPNVSGKVDSAQNNSQGFVHIQQRNLHKQFESIEMRPGNGQKKGSGASFVVNTLQTAN